MMIVPVRKYACGNLKCGFFGLVKEPDIWPALHCDEFMWPSIWCAGCDHEFTTVAERNEEVLHGWVPGIAQDGMAGPLPLPPRT